MAKQIEIETIRENAPSSDSPLERLSEALADELINMPIKKEAIRCLRAQQS
jgi:hypothetical protein